MPYSTVLSNGAADSPLVGNNSKTETDWRAKYAQLEAKDKALPEAKEAKEAKENVCRAVL